jgi:hypothetical protein
MKIFAKVSAAFALFLVSDRVAVRSISLFASMYAARNSASLSHLCMVCRVTLHFLAARSIVFSDNRALTAFSRSLSLFFSRKFCHLFLHPHRESPYPSVFPICLHSGVFGDALKHGRQIHRRMRRQRGVASWCSRLATTLTLIRKFRLDLPGWFVR